MYLIFASVLHFLKYKSNNKEKDVIYPYNKYVILYINNLESNNLNLLFSNLMLLTIAVCIQNSKFPICYNGII